jgi:tetratricopeptide (TPR) repeat protein
MSLRRGCWVFIAIGILLFLCVGVSAAKADEVKGKAETLFKEAVSLYEDGNLDKAFNVINEALKADSANPDIHDMAGYIMMDKGLLDGALKEFNSALVLNPRERTSRTGIGWVLFKKGDMKGAEEALVEALILNPYPSMTHYVLGLVYEQQGDYEKAVAHFKEGIKKYRSGKR